VHDDARSHDLDRLHAVEVTTLRERLVEQTKLRHVQPDVCGEAARGWSTDTMAAVPQLASVDGYDGPVDDPSPPKVAHGSSDALQVMLEQVVDRDA
jgi:hypothetical protein